MANESDVRAMRAENEARLKSLTIPEMKELRESLRTMAGNSAALLISNQEDFAPARYVKALLDFGDAVRRVHS